VKKPQWSLRMEALISLAISTPSMALTHASHLIL
jgi:hypothetical protein